MAADYGREIMVFGQTPIVCADTEKETCAYLDWYVDDMGDFESAGNLMSTPFATRSEPTARSAAGGEEPVPAADAAQEGRGPRRRRAGGPPEQVVDGKLELSKAGFDGSTVSWVNYEDGLVQFREQMLPLMISAGLRVEEPPCR